VTRRRAGVIASSPVLVGAITTLIVILAVFLAYNANNGLPFVPTYRVSAQVPNANTLVKGNDVRIGGVRVGLVEKIEPVQDPDTGAVHAKVDLKLDKSAEPIPKDSTVVVRSRSALGLKYLEINKGTSSAAQLNLVAFGDALAGRGPDLNVALGELEPLVKRLEPVARNLASPRTGVGRFFRALADSAAEVAPVAETQAQMFVALESTFGAFAEVARPYIQESISEAPPTFDTLIRTAPRIRSFLGHSASLFAELRPGIRALSESSPIVASAFETGARVLPDAPRLNAQLPPTARTLEAFAETTGVQAGIRRSTQLFDFLTPAIRFVGPAQTVCNYATLLARNAQDHLSVGDGIGNTQQFLVMSGGDGPNSENSPSSGPTTGGGLTDAAWLHANPYPNTASPGQPRECEAGKEPYIPNRVVVGNVPGNQGTRTEGQR
jgi:virulence factor Mce-like protein